MLSEAEGTVGIRDAAANGIPQRIVGGGKGGGWELTEPALQMSRFPALSKWKPRGRPGPRKASLSKLRLSLERKTTPNLSSMYRTPSSLTATLSADIYQCTWES